MERNAAIDDIERRRLLVRGTVQGVGFRPFVLRLAIDEALAGWVRNTGAGVEIEIEGRAGGLDAFARRLLAEAPPLARVERVEARLADPVGERGFAILPSGAAAGEPIPVPPDAAPCGACLAELRDPSARRHRYPFTNCTDCGPRFTIIEALPYDRARTTMRAFALCDACRAEYGDSADRRFHAEPIACPACGPRLELVDARGIIAGGALETAAAGLRAGRILALKGIGGYQLACDAGSAAAVARLRARKGREAKPFAVMAPDLDAVRALCHVDDAEAALLTGPRAPIVLLRRRTPPHGGAALADAVAPGLDTLGVMLPASPLHHLLAEAFGGVLVLTSGNRSEEPIAADDDDAERVLGAIGDAFLRHDRAIASRYDDSVVRADDAGGGALVLRRARGYAPSPIPLPRPAAAPILATGAQLKNTFCLVRGRAAYLSQHIGDLDDAATLAHYHHTLALYRRLFSIEPEVIAHDLHPDYATTRFARSLAGVVRVAVQHHHAHVVSCMAEHGVREPVLGVAFDGAGLGTDGSTWGGELLLADWKGFRRAAHLATLPLPGGDAAAREPWRMALAALAHAFGAEAAGLATRWLARIPGQRRRLVLAMIERRVNVPPASSAGRLFDAVASLVGAIDVNRYEGEAAMALEAMVDDAEAGAYLLPLRSPGRTAAAECAVWDPAPLIRGVVDDLRRGTRPGTIAARFHNALAAAVAEGCSWLREASGVDTVVLSGGCFQNLRLTRRTRGALRRAGFRVLTHHLVPPGDGGLSLGQAAVALAARDA